MGLFGVSLLRKSYLRNGLKCDGVAESVDAAHISLDSEIGGPSPPYSGFPLARE